MPPSPLQRLRAAWPVWLLLASLTAYGFYLWRYAAVLPGGSDSSGYFNTAKLLARGEVHAAMRPVEGLPPGDIPSYIYSPLGFKPDAQAGLLVPTYPIGLPLWLLVFIAGFGTVTGPNLVLVLHAIAGAALIFRFGRDLGLRPEFSALAAFTLGFSPLYLLYAIQAMSDVPAAVWVLAAVWLAWRSSATPWLAAGAGFAFGFAVLIRPTNLLAVLPVLAALGWSWRRWLALGAGGLPCAIALAWFNRTAYGSPFSSGYGNVAELLAWEWVLPTLKHYAVWLPVVGTPLLAASLALPWLARTAPRATGMLVAWIVPGLTFYAFYFHTHETWWYLRFILPVLPALIIAALLVLQAAADRISLRWIRCAFVILLIAVGLRSHRYWDHKWNIMDVAPGELVYSEVSAWAKTNLPPDSVLVAMQTSGALYYHTDFRIVRWDTLDNQNDRILAGLHACGRPVFGVFLDWEEKPAMQENLPGPWTKLVQVRQAGVWRLGTSGSR